MCQDKKQKLVGVYSGYQDATVDPQRITEDLPCDFVVLSLWATEDDGSDTLKAGATTDGNFLYGAGPLAGQGGQAEIYWGFKNVCVHPLYPPYTTDFIPVANVKDIFIRANKQSGKSARVGFSCFVYQEKE
jgi:hypothetical protein